MNTWLIALKHWNAQRGGTYLIPKKGTIEYNEVMAIKKCLDEK